MTDPVCVKKNPVNIAPNTAPKVMMDPNNYAWDFFTLPSTSISSSLGEECSSIVPMAIDPLQQQKADRAPRSLPWLCFYQKRSAWSMDQGSTKKRSAVHNFVPTVTKFCVMWEGLSLPHDTKFGNCRGEIVDRRMFFIWSLIYGSGWSRLIKAEPGFCYTNDSGGCSSKGQRLCFDAYFDLLQESS